MPLPIHSFSQEEIMAYLDGELSTDRAIILAKHLDTCEECRQHISDFQKLSHELATWQIDPIHSDAPQLPAKKVSPRFRIWRAAAMALGTLAVLIPLFFLTHPKQQRMFMSHSDPELRMAASEAVSEDQTSAQLIVRKAQLTLTASNFEPIRSEVERITKNNEGYIGQLQINSVAGQPRSLNATLHIPATHLDAALIQLKQLGRVNAESQSAEDVTRRHVDLEARLANLRTAEQRLRQLLENRTARLSEVLEVEQAIDKTRGEIDIAVAEQKTLSSQIEFSTVQLSVSEQVSDSILTPVGSTVLILILAGFFPALWLWRKKHLTTPT